MRLAIVGSTQLKGSEARALVRQVILDHMINDQYEEYVVCSGEAKGIDTLAREEAERLGVCFVPFPPNPSALAQCRTSEERWQVYQVRNIKIAEFCTKLVRISWKYTKTWGSGWTMVRAKDLGKPTQSYTLP